MAERVELIYGSKDGKTQIHATQWLPEERSPKAILQIIHGMKEHIDRYDAFARYMADRGFIVVGEDHLGHGETATCAREYGYFTRKEPDLVVVKDAHRLQKLIQTEYPGLPYFIYGFSMGSFIARKYLTMYGESLDGAVIGGTGWMPESTLNFGIFLCNIMGAFRGFHYRSPMITNMVFGQYNKKIHPLKTESDWLTTDDKIVEKYVADSRCTFTFTLNGYKTLFKLIKYVEQPENAKRIPENLPILFMSGKQDPVGDYGEGVKKAAELYIVNGMKHVGIKLYDDMRHEIHNEKRKHVVYLDILEWLESQM